jgi:hypothetical protein
LGTSSFVPKLDASALTLLGSRRVVADFSGGDVTSDAGGLLLREVEQKRTANQDASAGALDEANVSSELYVKLGQTCRFCYARTVVLREMI